MNPLWASGLSALMGASASACGCSWFSQNSDLLVTEKISNMMIDQDHTRILSRVISDQSMQPAIYDG